MNCYVVYFLASKPHGTLYIGVTISLLDRINEHLLGLGSKFTSRTGAKCIRSCVRCLDMQTTASVEEWVLGSSPRMTSIVDAQVAFCHLRHTGSPPTRAWHAICTTSPLAPQQ